jgi:hypothetical protein
MSHVQKAIDQALKSVESLRPLEDKITQAADVVKECLLNGGKMMACGNGGSLPGPVTARIQEAHKFIFHVICELVDPSLKR